MATNHSTHSSGIPRRDHANLMTFLETESKALVMSHELMCTGVSCSIASSSIFINRSEAVMVLRPPQKPCCICCKASCLRHASSILRSNSLHQSFRIASTSINGLRFPTLVISCGFFGIGTHHFCVHHSGVDFSSHMRTKQ